MKKAKTVGILGYGDVGKTIAKICKEAGFYVYIKDRTNNQLKGKQIDVLHVNIPEINNSQFIESVISTIEETMPKLTIINSSVTPGTTRKIFIKTKLPIVHSPIIGMHENLYDAIKKYFPKIIGGVNNTSIILAKEHFKKLGLKVVIFDNPENSEAAKLLDLVYYTWNIIFCKWTNEITKKHNLNFNQVYKLYNKIYNEGYKDTLPYVIRPVLTPKKGPIGGKCAIPDILLFDKFYKNNFTDFILKENEKYKKANE